MRAINFNAGPAGLPLPALERARDELLDFQGPGCRSWSTATAARSTRRSTTRRSRSLTRAARRFPTPTTSSSSRAARSQQFAHGADELPARRARAPTTWSPATGARRRSTRRSSSARPRVAADAPTAGQEVTRASRSRASSSSIRTRRTSTSPSTTPSSARSGTPSRHGQGPARRRHVVGLPVAADRRLASSRFIYAGAQKNLGPSGVRGRDRAQGLRGDAAARTSRRSSATRTHAENNSLYNTPPTFAIYLIRNVLAWIEELGGLRGDGAAEPREGRAALRRIDRLSRLLPRARGEGVALGR